MQEKNEHLGAVVDESLYHACIHVCIERTFLRCSLVSIVGAKREYSSQYHTREVKHPWVQQLKFLFLQKTSITHKSVVVNTLYVLI